MCYGHFTSVEGLADPCGERYRCISPSLEAYFMSTSPLGSRPSRRTVHASLKNSLIALAAATAVGGWGAADSFAATATWNVDASGSWGNAANWNPSTPPTLADDIANLTNN